MTWGERQVLLSALALFQQWNEVKHILKCMAWRRDGEWWREDTRARPKLEVMGRLMDCE